MQLKDKTVRDVALRCRWMNDSPVVEPVRIHNGAEENKGALRKSRGEEDEAFQILEYQAQKGNAGAMYKIGLFYYFGLRGLRRDRVKALSWFSKATDKGEAQSMEFLGEIYARGAGVERNYTKALEWWWWLKRRLPGGRDGVVVAAAWCVAVEQWSGGGCCLVLAVEQWSGGGCNNGRSRLCLGCWQSWVVEEKGSGDRRSGLCLGSCPGNNSFFFKC
ncbi:hypothetical protein LWI29_028969 [Acer saccharum]|uniref:Uncharacterized protein n=1 Tax=Acer saccharum TaxID=4024 RepID=A0AA39S4Q9_ACESA|nr:hypothetical protein LWI29_028969 [Acer saccharum]